MGNLIKESKLGFDFASVGSYTRSVNANRLQVHALAYSIFNWFRRLALSANMCKQRCPYKNECYETISNIGKLNV